MMQHASKEILADLGKLNPDQRAEIWRVAGTATGNAVRGADTRVTPVDMNKKIAPHVDVSQPNTNPPPMGSGKPLAGPWPVTPATFQSGRAVRGRIG